MNAITQQEIDNFLQLDWFSHIGEKLSEEGEVKVCVSWEEALKECQKNVWESVVSSTSNIMYAVVADLPSGNIERYETLYPELSDAVKRIADKAEQYIGLPKSKLTPIKSRITWDTAHYLYCCEFIDLFKESFPYRIGDLYLKGRFPCGWSGVFPYGKLIVF